MHGFFYFIIIYKSWFFLKRWGWWSLFFSFWKWMRHGRMHLVCELMHDLWKPWNLRKKWFFLFFFKMDEAWPNALVWQYMWIFEKLYCTTIFFGVKNKAKMDPRCEWKHKIRQLGHGWARCQSALLECQSAFEKCKLALRECLIWGADKRTQFFPNSLFFFPMCFLCFWVFKKKNIFLVWDYEILSQSAANSLNLFKLS